jgi:60 kDa SS-A/Ro ribonucleoprotein
MNKAYQNVSNTMNPINTPLNQPIPDKQMIQNAAGMYVFEVDIWKQLERFLITGTEGGSYYAGEAQLTKEAAKNTIKAIATDGKRAVDMIVAISQSGRALKNDQALFALALAAGSTDLQTSRYALSQLSKVARIGTHLFDFLNYVTPLRGWGRTLREAVSNWYINMKDDGLALQLSKYQQRNGWSHQDVFRMAHPKPQTSAQKLAFKWASGRYHRALNPKSEHYNLEQFQTDTMMLRSDLPLLYAFEQVKAAKTDREVVRLIEEYKLSMEHIPTEKRTKAVYDAIIPNLKIEALIRQLPTLTKNGVLGQLGSDNTNYIIDQLHNIEVLKKGRIHPIKVLIAMETYRSGRSAKGDSTWEPITRIVSAMDDAFYLSFGVVEPTNMKMLLALDVSGSMRGGYGGSVLGCSFLTPSAVTAAMSMVTARVEKDWYIMGFADTFRDLGVSPKDSLSETIRKTAGLTFSTTDCSLPMRWAMQTKTPVDAFVVYTDNETNRGGHPVLALKQYQQAMGIGAKLISVATNVNNVSIVEDTAMTLNVCGFSADVPHVISDFVTN